MKRPPKYPVSVPPALAARGRAAGRGPDVSGPNALYALAIDPGLRLMILASGLRVAILALLDHPQRAADPEAAMGAWSVAALQHDTTAPDLETATAALDRVIDRAERTGATRPAVLERLAAITFTSDGQLGSSTRSGLAARLLVRHPRHAGRDDRPNRRRPPGAPLAEQAWILGEARVGPDVIRGG